MSLRHEEEKDRHYLNDHVDPIFMKLIRAAMKEKPKDSVN